MSAPPSASNAIEPAPPTLYVEGMRPDGATIGATERPMLELGRWGMHGTYYANMAVSSCDVLIAIAARFDDRVTGKIHLIQRGR